MNGKNISYRILEEEIRAEKKITLFRITFILVALILFSTMIFLNREIPLSSILITYILLLTPFLYSLFFYFMLSKRIFYTILRYINAFFDVGLICFIMISIYFFNHFIPNLIILIGVPHLFFFILITLSGLRLHWKITLFNGILAGLIYLVFYIFLLPENIVYLQKADTVLLKDALGYLVLPKGAPFMRMILLVFAGGIAAYTSFIFKRIILRLNQSAEEKINYLEILLSGISHNLNNPLNYLMGFNEHLKDDMNKFRVCINDFKKKYRINMPLEDIDCLEKVTQSINENQENLSISLDKIIKTLELIKNFSRKKEKKYKWINIHTEVTKIIKLFKHKIKDKAIDIQNNIEDNLFIQYQWLDEVLMNLILNAIEAVSKNGRIKLFIKKQSTNIKIAIKDNGAGISQKDQEKIFLPYFTTKSKTSNRGLGLCICANLLKNINGKISFSSIKGKTIFYIVIPREYIKIQ